MGSFKIVEVERGHYRCVCQNNPVYDFDVYPLDSMRSPPPTDLTIEVAECLKSEIRKRGCKPESRSFLGLCHQNSRELFDHLNSKGYDPVIHIGANEGAGPARNPIDSFKNIKNAHQWVETDSYTAEICSEANQSTGHIYISKRRPSNYKSYFSLTKDQIRDLPSRYITIDNIEFVTEYIKNK